MAQSAITALPFRRCSNPHLFFPSNHKPYRHSFLFSFSFSFSFSQQARGLRPLAAPASEDESEDYNEEERYRSVQWDERKSRNELKKEARRAVRWGMELAKFSPHQIKRALKVASLEREVFDALMLVKRLGPDVREGKRRQFNYIGRLLRKAKPELMDALIQAYKDGDHSRLIALSGQDDWSTEENESEQEITSDDFDNENEGNEQYVQLASRWLEGLISKDVSITNEVYSIHTVDFDRQELRKLVRRVQSVQEKQTDNENNSNYDVMLSKEKRPLARFLYSLAKKLSD